jgi:hypothetical protein
VFAGYRELRDKYSATNVEHRTQNTEYTQSTEERGGGQKEKEAGRAHATLFVSVALTFHFSRATNRETTRFLVDVSRVENENRVRFVSNLSNTRQEQSEPSEEAPPMTPLIYQGQTQPLVGIDRNVRRYTSYGLSTARQRVSCLPVDAFVSAVSDDSEKRTSEREKA